MHRKVRRVSVWLPGVAALVAGALFVYPGTEGHAETTSGIDAEAVAAAGATTPFVTVEAETGTRAGGATLRALTPGAAAPTAASLETEASGYSLVELKATGASVTITNNTGKSANTLVVRASIPDAAAGGGITASLNLYVNGVYRQAISLSSKQAWNYRDATTNPDDPKAGGSPYRFYNEFPVWVTGTPIAAGSTIKLQKDAANTAAVYDIDSVDLENVGAAAAQPANSLSVVTYGADPSFVKDSTVAIQNTVNAAKTQGKSVWIPSGKYLTNSLTATALNFTGVKVQGAGMWYTTIYRKVPLPTPAGWRSQILVGSGTTVTDLQIDANATWRGVGGNGGSDYGINASGAGGWLIDRIWTRHIDANWLSGTNGVIQNSRTADTYGDGFNVNNGASATGDKAGKNITVQNNFARNTGDDSFANYSDAGPDGTNPQVSGTKILNNTAIAPWWANGIRIAGGQNIEVKNNLVNSVSSNSAMDLGVFGDTGNPLTSVTISGNVLNGGGGWNGTRHGVRISSPSSTSLFPTAYSTVTMTDNIMNGSLRAGIYVDKTRVNLTLTNNTINRPAKQGIWIPAGVTGTGTFTGNTVTNLFSGQVATQNDSASTFKITG
ncbi:right-handed parallel beta-helix repeat-containing protein [Streptomyces sp. NPDC005808]|uniref:right-handed parallel beta-helix repeat-containing protein n=1 Tax=Streptomyces sp. NPDC005808 TaxID=3364734 RepID=UPI0036B18BEB